MFANSIICHFHVCFFWLFFFLALGHIFPFLDILSNTFWVLDIVNFMLCSARFSCFFSGVLGLSGRQFSNVQISLSFWGLFLTIFKGRFKVTFTLGYFNLLLRYDFSSDSTENFRCSRRTLSFSWSELKCLLALCKLLKLFTLQFPNLLFLVVQSFILHGHILVVSRNSWSSFFIIIYFY